MQKESRDGQRRPEGWGHRRNETKQSSVPFPSIILDFAKEMVKILEVSGKFLGIFPIVYTSYLCLSLLDLFYNSESPGILLLMKMSLVHGNENVSFRNAIILCYIDFSNGLQHFLWPVNMTHNTELWAGEKLILGVHWLGSLAKVWVAGSLGDPDSKK